MGTMEHVGEMQVVDLQEEPAPLEAQNLAGPIRAMSGKSHGQFWAVLSNAGVSRNSRVLASITEIAFDGAGAFPVKGFARCEVSNVVPTDSNQLNCWVNIGWDTDLSYRIYFTVE
jgi:hypothetical protein